MLYYWYEQPSITGDPQGVIMFVFLQTGVASQPLSVGINRVLNPLNDIPGIYRGDFLDPISDWFIKRIILNIHSIWEFVSYFKYRYSFCYRRMLHMSLFYIIAIKMFFPHKMAFCDANFPRGLGPCFYTHMHLRPLLLTWFNFNPSMDT